MAAVVINPQAKDFHGLTKKNLANASGALAFIRSEINFRNIRIEAKRSIKANPEIMKGLGTMPARNSTKWSMKLNELLLD